MAWRRLHSFVSVVASTCGIAGCSSDVPGICDFEDAEEAGLRVMTADDAYFYADDEDGTQVGYDHGGAVLALEPGVYSARLNGSRHPVEIRRGQVTRCVTATLKVEGGTDEYYYVLDTLSTQLSYARLGQPISLFPGQLLVRLNNTVSATALRPGDTTEIAAATFQVTGSTDEYYYVLDEDAGRQLAYAKLGQPMSLFSGRYKSKVNNSLASFTLEAGDTTELASGTVLGTGTTDEYYYVLDTAGTQLGYARLGTGSAYLPGTYRLRLINNDVPLTVEGGQTLEIVTGTLMVSGSETDYYYILDSDGTQLGYKRLNTPASLLPDTYMVRVGDRTDSVTISAESTRTLAR